jgi:hypothetical protein
LIVRGKIFTREQVDKDDKIQIKVQTDSAVFDNLPFPSYYCGFYNPYVSGQDGGK